MMNQTFIEVTDKNAGVHEIIDNINTSTNWGEHGELVLVTADGLKINDCEGTRGKRTDNSLLITMPHASVLMHISVSNS